MPDNDRECRIHHILTHDDTGTGAIEALANDMHKKDDAQLMEIMLRLRNAQHAEEGATALKRWTHD